jgi:hypothetical protein
MDRGLFGNDALTHDQRQVSSQFAEAAHGRLGHMCTVSTRLTLEGDSYESVSNLTLIARLNFHPGGDDICSGALLLHVISLKMLRKSDG